MTTLSWRSNSTTLVTTDGDEIFTVSVVDEDPKIASLVAERGEPLVLVPVADGKKEEKEELLVDAETRRLELLLSIVGRKNVS